MQSKALNNGCFLNLWYNYVGGGAMVKLTEKQEKFIQGLLKGLSQREAYKQSYDTSKKTNKTIDEMACKLLKTSKVGTRYEELRARLAKELEDECIIDAKKIIREINAIAFDDISNYLEYKTVLTEVGKDKEQKPIIRYDTIINLKDSKTINTRNISELSRGKDGTFKFKLYCKDTALYKLAEYAGLNKGDNNTENTDIKIDIIGNDEDGD